MIFVIPEIFLFLFKSNTTTLLVLSDVIVALQTRITRDYALSKHTNKINIAFDAGVNGKGVAIRWQKMQGIRRRNSTLSP